MPNQLYRFDGTNWKGRGRTNISSVTSLPGYTLILDEQFAGGLDSSRWHAYDPASGDSTFGAPTRIQSYRAANAIAGAGSTGATNGTSLKLKTLEIDAGSGTLPTAGADGTRYSYTAGMVDSKTVNKYYPRYCRFEWRFKTPHGQGLWPALWGTARIGGANEAEFDFFEYFHSLVPGRFSVTIHGTDNTGQFHTNRYTNNGNAANGGGPTRTPFENPTYTPGWHKLAAEIVPVTDSTGTVLASPTAPSSFVRLTIYLDDVQVWQIVDTSALHYTTNGGSEDSFWNIYMQGCQVDGDNVGHPRSPLGYGHWQNACLIGGTAPNSCTIAANGVNAQAAVFSDPTSTFEIDYFKCWKFTG